ncbi:Cdc6/Cdc18 family protein [Nanoarchaeota archaeon]
MGLFKDMLKSDETLFRNSIALDYDYIPKLIPYREVQQKHIATCIKPLFQERNGRNLFIYGQPGIGKTVACKHVLKEIEEEYEEVTPVYINCWQKNTTYKVLMEICDILGYAFTQNKKSDELFKVIKEILNKSSVVLVFDEIDKADDYDFIYFFLEEIYRKAVFLITNYKEWIINLDERLKSRLTAEMMEFKPYNLAETKGILKERVGSAFVPNVLAEKAFDTVVNKTAELEDIRSGLYIMKEAANLAEDESSKKITEKHVEGAIQKLKEFTIKKTSDIDEEMQSILDIVKFNSGKKAGDLFKVYQEQGGKSVYKTFKRKLDKLEKGKFIVQEKTEGGSEGNITIVKLAAEEKKLTEF